MLRVLYDGWPLVYQPESPAALHLLALLENTPGEVEPVVALPSQPPGWLPERAQVHILQVGRGIPARLRWEQRSLLEIFKSVGASLLHLATPNPPLFGPLAVVVSPTVDAVSDRHGRLAGRLREALSAGGMARLRGLVWPADLPAPRTDLTVFSLPPVIPAVFQPGVSQAVQAGSGPDLPETFVLYHGPQSETALRRLLQAWTWAAGPVGQYYPLLLAGLEDSGRQVLKRLGVEYGVSDTVRALEPLSPNQLAHIYRACAALFHPAPISPWGGSVRCALACGRPVVALEDSLTDALVGPAGYLVPAGHARSQGAALITVIVEQVVSEQLSQAARQRSAAWETAGFPRALLAAYQQVIYSP